LEGDFYVDEGEEAIREDISTLYLGLSQYPGKPSDGQIRKTKLLEKRFAEVVQKFDDFSTQTKGLNDKLGEGVNPIKLKTFEEYMK